MTLVVTPPRCRRERQAGSCRRASVSGIGPARSLLYSALALCIAFGAQAQSDPAASTQATQAATSADDDLLADVPMPDAPIESRAEVSDTTVQTDAVGASMTRPSSTASTQTELSQAIAPVDGNEVAVDASEADPVAMAPVEAASVPEASLPAVQPGEADIDMEAPPDKGGRFAEWLDPLRVSLKHEVSYKFAAPKRIVNNRSSVRLEYSKLFAERVFFRLDTKLNVHWANDHRARAKREDPFRELVTREAYLQASFGETSLRLGYQILPWGVSEGGAITDEVSPRNTSEFFFVPLEESRIGQPMLTMDHFGDSGQWTAFFVPRPAYNKYPDVGSEYDIPGAFVKNAPDDDWGDTGSYEYGVRWKRTFGKSDLSVMAASLIDNDYLVRQQRFQMYGFTANIAKKNMLYRAEVALKQPRAFFAGAATPSGLRVVESDQFDSTFGFDYSPGGRPLTYSAEVVWSRLTDWDKTFLGRERDEYSLVGAVSNRFLNDDLTLSWLTIYTEPYTTFQHRFLSSYLLDDNSTFYFEFFYPDEHDSRSGSFPYRNEKQVVFRYQYQF